MRFNLPSRAFAARRSSGAQKAAGARAPALSLRWQRRPAAVPSLLRLIIAAAGISTQHLEMETKEGFDEGSSTGRGSRDPAGEPEAPTKCSGGALSLAGPGGDEQEVPKTLRQALSTFFSHPSTILILCGLAALLYARVQQPVHPAADAAVAGAVAVAWCLQEWVVHAMLLHSSFDWLGRRIHVGHHQRPYFHVSVDDPPIVLAFMAASLGLFWLGFHGSELALTAALSYFTMGLLYEWSHYVVHTRYVPRTRLGKAVRMHHMLHHTRNEAYWLAFTVPQVDALFGTAPDPASVRMSGMARASLKSARARAEAVAGAGAEAAAGAHTAAP